MDPRISFSNDFVDTTQHAMKNYREAPVSSDFEFSVKNYSMKSADEIIFQGVLVPVKDNNNDRLRKTTLKEELLVGDDEDDFDDVFARPARNLGWWKERLGLKKPNNLHRKCRSGEIVLESVNEEGNNNNDNIFALDTALAKKENQESLFEGGLKKCIENAM